MHCFAVCAPRKYDNVENKWELIGNSKEGYKKLVDDDKDHRSVYFPSYFNRPLNQGGFNSPGTPYIQSSLISSNIHLLEPFLLVTFLVFVLSLLDKARLLPALTKRRDETHGHPHHHNLTNSGFEGFYHQDLFNM